MATKAQLEANKKYYHKSDEIRKKRQYNNIRSSARGFVLASGSKKYYEDYANYISDLEELKKLLDERLLKLKS